MHGQVGSLEDSLKSAGGARARAGPHRGCTFPGTFRMKLTVVGGTGFVGSRVVREGLRAGLRVSALSRRGVPDQQQPALAGADWVRCDVEDTSALREALAGSDAVISCLGAFGSDAHMRRVNGTANVNVIREAAAAGVRKFAFVSAAVFRPVYPLVRGYYDGKREAERAVESTFGQDGLILRPGAIYGSRAVSPSISIPIGAIGVPLNLVLESRPMRALATAAGPLGDLLTPWVSVDDVAGAAIAHVAGGEGDGRAGGGEGGGEGGGGGRGGSAKVLEWGEIAPAASAFRTAAAADLALLWDGSCPLCSLEIGYYRRIDAEKRVEWVDLTQSADWLDAAGVTRDEALALMHAVELPARPQPQAHGEAAVTPAALRVGGSPPRVLVGVDAFLAVWDRLPGWSYLPPLLRAVPAARPAADLAYGFWARNRWRVAGRIGGKPRGLARGSACDLNDPGACGADSGASSGKH